MVPRNRFLRIRSSKTICAFFFVSINRSKDNGPVLGANHAISRNFTLKRDYCRPKMVDVSLGANYTSYNFFKRGA